MSKIFSVIGYVIGFDYAKREINGCNQNGIKLVEEE